MSMFREALRALLSKGLVCVRCRAQNRPGATCIDLDLTGDLDLTASRACCGVCHAEGPLATFQPQGRP